MAASDSDFLWLEREIVHLMTTDNTLTAGPLNAVKPTCKKRLIFADICMESGEV